MATKLFLRNTTLNGITDTGDGVVYDLSTTAGAAADTGVVNTAAGGTNIQWTKTAGGLSMAWITGRVPAGGFTLTSVDISAWLQESATAANARGRVGIYRYQPGGTVTQLGGSPINDDKLELSTSATEDTWVANVTDTAFSEDDRILVRFFITNNGTMGGGRTATMTFNAADAATGDSFINLAETVAFKGNSYTLVANAGNYPYSGVAVNFLRGHRLVAEVGNYPYSGVAATLAKGFRLTANVGNYPYSGVAATLRPPIRLTAEPGNYPYSGVAATLARGHRLSAVAGNYPYGGVAVNFNRGYALAAAAGNYPYSGVASNLLRGHRLAAVTGNYPYNGVAATFQRTYRLPAEPGNYPYTGVGAGLTQVGSYQLVASPGNYPYSGSNTGLTSQRRMTAEPGNYPYSGVSASLLRSYRLAADPGGYPYTGRDAGFSVSLPGHVTLVASPGNYAFNGGSVGFTIFSPIDPDRVRKSGQTRGWTVSSQGEGRVQSGASRVDIQYGHTRIRVT